MDTHLDLVVTADHPNHTADFRLLDAGGAQLAYRRTDFKTISLEEKNLLATALARVPWEIARPSPDRPTLGERNLLVRVVHDMRAPASQPLELAADEASPAS